MKESNFLLAGAICVVLTACTGKNEEKLNNEVYTVKTEKVTFASDAMKTPYVGVVKEESSVMVSFSGMGVLKSVAASEGKTVQKGQLLAAIDDSQARNALAMAKSALEQAKDAEARMRQLHEAGSLPDIKWIEVKSKVEQAEASYAMCKKSLEDCTVYAPISGVVGTKIMSVGENVLPTEPVMTILNINNVKVQVSIPEKEIGKIDASTPATITVEALNGQSFQGGTIEKGVSADPLTHTYNVYVNMQNTERKLLPGMVANVCFDVSGGQQVLTVPVKSVQQNSDKSLFVWLNDNGKAKRTKITLGETVGNRVVIASGLKEGDNVVVEGYQKLSEGTSVR